MIMTYADTINTIISRAQEHPGINTAYYGNVLWINERRDIIYPVFCLAPRITTPVSDLWRFGFVAWYIDILERERHNYAEIQSDGITILTEIGLKLADESEQIRIINNPLTVFMDRFNDICAGAVRDIDIETPAIICADY